MSFEFELERVSERERERESRFLTTHQHILGYTVSFTLYMIYNTKYSTTKLPWFSGLLPHSARKRGGLIYSSRAHTGRAGTSVAEDVTYVTSGGGVFQVVAFATQNTRSHTNCLKTRLRLGKCQRRRGRSLSSNGTLNLVQFNAASEFT